MSQDFQDSIRSQIRPFPRIAIYSTGWAGKQTFEQIADSLSPFITSILHRYGTYGQDVPDSIQTGLMRLWEQLVEAPTLLAEHSRLSAAFRVVSISKHTTLQKQNRKYIPFSVLEDGSELDVDEYGIRGYATPSEWWNSVESWASWASKVDQRLDITAAITAIAEEYINDIKGLVALYILTTSVDSKAAIEAHGLGHSQVYVRMIEIRRKLQALFAEYAPRQPKTWEERYHEGDDEPLLRVMEQYHDTPLALKAIETLTSGAKLRRIAANEKERKMLMYYRKKCGRQIAAAYGQAVAF
ncbi:MAG: hypothetical protein L6Q98_16800 [Anaerolineae bacterium]|nr:hypothetical protein [Anaerolineae bacterium]NUQ03902.1 hypothetical protein [Anaerolineae bacterium]